jgi:hypothetical protein
MSKLVLDLITQLGRDSSDGNSIPRDGKSRSLAAWRTNRDGNVRARAREREKDKPFVKIVGSFQARAYEVIGMSVAVLHRQRSYSGAPKLVSTRCGICEVKVNFMYMRARARAESAAHSRTVTHSYNILTTGRGSPMRAREERTLELEVGIRARRVHE